MKLEGIKTTIENWIKTCETEEQLAVCQDATDELLFNRYKNHVSPGEMSQTLSYLQGVTNTIRDQIREKNLAGLAELEANQMNAHVWWWNLTEEQRYELRGNPPRCLAIQDITRIYLKEHQAEQLN